MACKQQSPDMQHVGHHSNGFTCGPHDHSKVDFPNGLNLTTDKPVKEETTQMASYGSGAPLNGWIAWASRELLDFVAHMKNGDISVLSQFDVQALLLKYIKKNCLRDPHRKRQIICDLRLKNLFGKPRVGHIEMLKLLEYHFLNKEDSQGNAFIPAGIVSSMKTHFGLEETNRKSPFENKNKRRKTRKKVEERVPRNNLDEYAAIDTHNINLIYMRRDLMESLTEDEKFCDKVVGSIVRIRISSSDQKQDMYRLVQVVGTSKLPVPYKSGEKTLDIMLEVLNLNKKEAIAVDAISNQEFSEEECRRLRQSIRCGLVKQFTVGEIQKKAMELQAVGLKYRLEEEILKLNNLRDRASEKGCKRELREYIERLQLLKTPEEHQRRLCEIPEVHADPKMNPDYESEEDAGGVNDNGQGEYTRPKHSALSRCRNKPTTLKRKVEEGMINRQRRTCQRRDGNCLNDQAVTRSGPEIPITASHATTNPYSPSDSETDKLWHYRDPSDNIQGPFSMVQLQKWSTTGYFPPDLRIWTINEQDDSILLTDALNGSFHTAAHLLFNFSLQCQQLGAASDNGIDSSNVGSNENMDRSENDNQIVEASLSSNARVQSVNANEFVGTDGSGSISASSSLSVISEKEMQPGASQHREIKDNNSCSNHSQVCRLSSSSDVEPKLVALPHDEQGLESEGSRHSPGLDNKGSHGAANHIPDAENENQSNGKSCPPQSSGQSWRSFPINLNSDIMEMSSGFSPVTNSNSCGLDGDADLPGFPTATPKDGNRESEGQAAETLQPLALDVPIQVSDMQDFPSPTLKSANGNQEQPAESNQPPPAKVAGPDSGPTWSSASSLVVGGAQLPEIADEWGRYSPTHPKPSTEEWSSGIVSVSSLKQPEVCDHATPTSNINPFVHASPSQPAPDTSNWHIIIEPIEFSTLAEESVSDLLAEVDAMESQCGLGSPTSAMRCGHDMMNIYKNDSFSIDDLSPSPDPGRSDAFSSTGDLQLPCQSSISDERVGASCGDAYDPLKQSSGMSSTSSEGETKSADIPAIRGEAGSAAHRHVNLSSGLAGTEPVWGVLPGHVNLDWGAPLQGFTNLGWDATQVPWGNLNVNRSAFNGVTVWDGQQRHPGGRYTGPIDWVQGGEMGHGRGRPFWNRPPPKGQRVCKSYEGGNCKKGASCDYLHP